MSKLPIFSKTKTYFFLLSRFFTQINVFGSTSLGRRGIFKKSRVKADYKSIEIRI